MRPQPLPAASSSAAAFTTASCPPRLPHFVHPPAVVAARLCGAAAEGSLAKSRAAAGQPSYQEALAASLSRSTLRWETLAAAGPAAAAATAGSKRGTTRLQRMRQRLEGSAVLPPFQDAFDRAGGAAGARVDAELQEWQAAAHQRPAGFDSQAQLAEPGVADVAAVTRGGRFCGCWKEANQDAYSLSTPADGTLLVTVCDGHGHSGELASRAAADGLAAALPGLLASGSGSGGGSAGGRSEAAAAASQLALVAAFQHVGGGMRHHPAFAECGAAVAACLVQRGSLTVAWAGDCRATMGLYLPSPQGPRCLVHPLTQDHKPGSPLERARIAASGRGRLVQREPGQPHRLTGSPSYPTPNSLSLSRGFGDAWAVPLGFTAEPDAVTLTLPPAENFAAADASSGEHDAAALALPLSSSLSASGSTSSTSTMAGSLWAVDSSSSDSDEVGGRGDGSGRDGRGAAPPARHVLVLGCDGLWDVVTDEEVVGIAQSCVSAEAAAHALVHVARRRWAAAYGGLESDDITAAVAFLPC